MLPTRFVSIYLIIITLSSGIAYSSENEKLLCYVLSVDKNGDTFFSEKYIELNPWTSGLAAASLPENTELVRFFKAKPRWEMPELHHAPARQYLLVLQGVIEFKTSLNDVRRFEKGSVILVEDTFGKGHATKSVGKEDLVLVWVSIPTDD